MRLFCLEVTPRWCGVLPTGPVVEPAAKWIHAVRPQQEGRDEPSPHDAAAHLGDQRLPCRGPPRGQRHAVLEKLVQKTWTPLNGSQIHFAAKTLRSWTALSGW